MQKIHSLLKNIAIYAIVFIAIYSVVNWWRQPTMPAMPFLQFSSIDHQPIDIQKMSHERPVLVYFWGSWCPICRQTSPSVNEIAKTDEFAVVSIAVQSGDNQEVAHYLQQHQWQFVTVNDREGDIFAAWQGQLTPSFVIIKNGKMVQGLTGIHPAWELKLRLRWLAYDPQN